MNTYKITLHFSFYGHSIDDDYDPYASDGEDNEEGELNESAKAKAFRRTDEYFSKNSVEEHVKGIDAMSFVEYILADAEILTAEWDKEKFAMTILVTSPMSQDELHNDLEMTSLEDGEYEACGDTGWIIMTRGPNGERFGPPWDMKDFWEYGLTDYRRNPIEIEVVE